MLSSATQKCDFCWSCCSHSKVRSPDTQTKVWSPDTQTKTCSPATQTKVWLPATYIKELLLTLVAKDPHHSNWVAPPFHPLPALLHAPHLHHTAMHPAPPCTSPVIQHYTLHRHTIAGWQPFLCDNYKSGQEKKTGKVMLGPRGFVSGLKSTLTTIFKNFPMGVKLYF